MEAQARPLTKEDDGKGYRVLVRQGFWLKNSGRSVQRLNVHSSPSKGYPQAHGSPTQSEDGIKECNQRMNGVLGFLPFRLPEKVSQALGWQRNLVSA